MIGVPVVEGGREGVDPSEELLDRVTKQLCEPESYSPLAYRQRRGLPMPSVAVLAEIVDKLRGVLFPGYFGDTDVTPASMPYAVGNALHEAHRLLSGQIARGVCPACLTEDLLDCPDCERQARTLSLRFMDALPRIRKLLATDVIAAYTGDPAAKSVAETIFCYPSLVAMTHYRIAHELHRLDVAIIPRIITEMAHSATGIDIHPAAEIGEGLFIDHGTGTVVGETCIIGNNVRIYQSVTLGAKSIPRENAHITGNGPRHPIIEDDVVIYSGATILGRVRIGRGSVIGGNVWLTGDVPSNSRVVQGRADRALYENGDGI